MSEALPEVIGEPDDAAPVVSAADTPVDADTAAYEAGAA